MEWGGPVSVRDDTSGLGRAPSRRLPSMWWSVVDWFFTPVDARVYACVRIAYALTCLVILLELWPVRMTYLSGEGSLVPVVTPLLSPLAWSRSALTVNMLMGSAVIAALCLTLGVMVRLSTFVLFVWHVSFVGAAYMVMSGFDMMMRLVGFVLLLAPTTRAWTLAGRSSPGLAEQAPAYALRLIQFQTCVMYWATVWLKAPDPFWRSGELMAYFHLSLFARFPSPAVADYPGLSVIATWSVLAVEVALPLLLFGRSTRRAGLVLGALLHGGIAVTSKLSVFSLSMLPLYASFLQGSDVDALIRWVKGGAKLRAA